MNWLLVGLGGGTGAILRYWVGKLVSSHVTSSFPYGTLLVNITGSFLIGLIFGTIIEHEGTSDNWRLLLVVGLLGGYTTFSAFAWETIGLIEDRAWFSAAAYVLASNAVGLAACAIGLMFARQLAG